MYQFHLYCIKNKKHCVSSPGESLPPWKFTLAILLAEFVPVVERQAPPLSASITVRDRKSLWQNKQTKK